MDGSAQRRVPPLRSRSTNRSERSHSGRSITGTSPAPERSSSPRLAPCSCRWSVRRGGSASSDCAPRVRRRRSCVKRRCRRSSRHSPGRLRSRCSTPARWSLRKRAKPSRDTFGAMSDAGPLVLLIEDEPQMRRFLRAALESHGYRFVEATTAREGLAQATSRTPDVILLDLGLPDGDGLDLARRIREWTTTPIVVISARGKEQDKVAALDTGADDYLTKPFGTEELLARMRVASRHTASAGAGADPVFVAGDLRVDLPARRVFVGNDEVHLTPTEYKLLTALVHDAGKVLTHRQLLRAVWGPNAVEHTHYLRVYMTQLRHKLEPDPTRPRHLQTEPGVGYRLKLE